MFDFWQDAAARRFFSRVLALAALLLAGGVGAALLAVETVQSVLVAKEAAVASSLLAAGVPEAAVTAALNTQTQAAEGARLVAQLGHETAAYGALAMAGERGLGLAFLAGAAALALAWVLAACRFLQGQTADFHRAAAVVAAYARGDWSEPLEAAADGARMQLYGAVDNLAQAMRAANDHAQSARAFLKSLVSDVSHQLKTPLAALAMNLEIISAEPDNAATVARFAARSQQAVEGMTTLIQSLLKMSRFDAGAIVFEPRPVAASALAETALANLRSRAEGEGKRLLVQGDGAVRLFCDPTWTAEALANLVKNALDHTEGGAEIVLRWRQTPLMTQFAVADDGAGISEEDLHHIFKRFYRSAASASGGVGLGLSLAKAIAEGQGGTLEVQSRLGEGSIFTLTFLTKM